MMLSSLGLISIPQITASIQVRKTTEDGVRRMMRRIQERGYLERYPIAVTPLAEGGYKLLDGNHRVEAVRRLGLDMPLPAQVYEGLTPDDEYRIAYESNTAHDVIVLQDWTDDAEFIWSLASGGKTQQEIAGIVGWSRGQVSQYTALHGITPDAWAIVVATTKQPVVATEEDEVVAPSATVVARVFSERLLRSIVALTAEQQLELIKDLAKAKIDKTKFKQLAERYKVRNWLLAEAARRLHDLPEEYLERAIAEINKGIYDKEQQPGGVNFEKLIQQLLDEYAQHANYRLIVAGVAEMDKQLDPESVDVIITDPPYGREYLKDLADLAKLATYVLKPNGWLAVMIGQSYLPEVLQLVCLDGLRYHWTIAYLTPGGQSPQLWDRQVNSFWKPVLWFIKGEYKGKWIGDVAKSAVNDNDKRHHKWGQSETGMADLMERLSNPGDVVLDPFLGGGTTGVVALAMGRKFIGSDIRAEEVETSRKRLEEEIEESDSGE